MNTVTDYVTDAASKGERDWHDKEYAENPWYGQAPLDSIDLRALWIEDDMAAVLEEMTRFGLHGKRVLLLGNGTSIKELHLLDYGALLTVTDLSRTAMDNVRSRLLASKLGQTSGHRCEFHCVNALQMPYPDQSFDVIYGLAFIHHVPDIDGLFREISRVLKPGGMCRFVDSAYSPAWQAAKATILHPLQMWTHRNQGISPEDVIATQKGGYTIPEMEVIRQRYGFRDMMFKRTSLFGYLWHRARCKIGGAWMHPFYPLMRWIDRQLDRWTPIMRSQGISLYCGFNK